MNTTRGGCHSTMTEMRKRRCITTIVVFMDLKGGNILEIDELMQSRLDRAVVLGQWKITTGTEMLNLAQIAVRHSVVKHGQHHG